MAKSLSILKKYFAVEKLIYHSIDISLYQASVIIDGEEHYVADESGRLLKTFSLLEMQKLCQGIPAELTVVRHVSAYDEMIGGPEKVGPNTLEVPVYDNKLY